MVSKLISLKNDKIFLENSLKEGTSKYPQNSRLKELPEDFQKLFIVQKSDTGGDDDQLNKELALVLPDEVMDVEVSNVENVVGATEIDEIEIAALVAKQVVAQVDVQEQETENHLDEYEVSDLFLKINFDSQPYLQGTPTIDLVKEDDIPRKDFVDKHQTPRNEVVEKDDMLMKDLVKEDDIPRKESVDKHQTPRNESVEKDDMPRKESVISMRHQGRSLWKRMTC